MSITQDDATPATTNGTKTSYTVLRRNEGNTWEEVSTQDAGSARQAIKRALEEAGSKEGVFVAVASHSWKPQRVKSETQLVVKMEDAKV